VRGLSTAVFCTACQRLRGEAGWNSEVRNRSGANTFGSTHATRFPSPPSGMSRHSDLFRVKNRPGLSDEPIAFPSTALFENLYVHMSVARSTRDVSRMVGHEVDDQ